MNKNVACVHCKRLRDALNCDTIKLCLKKEDLPGEFELVEIKKYLEKYLRTDPILYHSKEENQVKLSIGSLDVGRFFLNKETL